MTRLDRHLVVLVILVTLTAVVLSLPRGHARAATGVRLESIPTELGPWRARIETAEDLLPPDPRSLESLTRVYDHGQRRLWVGVARYTGENGPEKRPGLDVLVTRGVTSIARDADTLPLGGSRSLRTMRLSMGLRGGQTVTAWYWYQVGPRAVGDDYRLRFWLGLNAILARHDPLFLVRVATMDSDAPNDFVQSLVPYLDNLVAQAERH